MKFKISFYPTGLPGRVKEVLILPFKTIELAIEFARSIVQEDHSFEIVQL